MDSRHKAFGITRGKRTTLFMIFPLICLWILGLSSWACTQTLTWDPQPYIPNYDSQRWERVITLWKNHYDGKNLDEIITALNQIKDANPSKYEPILSLARAHYLHARYTRQDREDHFAKSEQYAAQACKMNPKDFNALAALVETLCYSRDRDYIMKKYAALIKSYAPAPSIEALPDMNYQGWDAFKKVWMARGDVEKAKAAAAMADKMAQDHPTDGLAQIWASRANNCVGLYYTGMGEHDTKGMPFYEKGILYGTKARKLLPNSVPANYWYQCNLARSIQFTNLLNKGRHLMALLEPLYFCSKENSIYYFCGPLLTCAGTITNGGFVAEKGMRLANVTLDMAMNGLELAEIMFPNFYYISYARADVLAFKGKKKEALAILDRIIKSDPNIDPLIPENQSFVRLAKRLHSEIK